MKKISFVSERKIEYKKQMSRIRLAVLLVAFGTLVVYLPVSHDGFSVYDDKEYVTDNPVVQNGLTWNGIKWAFTTWHATNWHPLTWISHMMDCELFGMDPGAAHDVNVLFHAANAALLLILLWRMTGAIWPAAFTAALFAWHPLHVESVAWISERKDVLSTFFALLTLLAYTKYASLAGRVARPSPALLPTSYWLAIFFFALALMSKPMVVTLPFLMLLLDFWPLQRMERMDAAKIQRVLVEKIPFFVLAAASCVVTFLAQRHGGAVISLEDVPLALRLENVSVAYTLYLLKLFWPAHLAVFYPFPPSIPTLEVAGALAILGGITLSAWRVRKKFPYFLVGWLWFLGTLVPAIGLVQVGGAAMADRYTYFPSIGIFLVVALALRDVMAKFHLPGQIIAAGGVLVLAICIGLTRLQLAYWSSDVSLFTHAIAVTRENQTALVNLGFAYEKAGDKSQAMDEYRRALRLNPDNVQVQNNLANLLAETGHPEEALAEYQSALRLEPDSAEAHDNLGTLYVQLGQFDAAEKQYLQAAQLDPADWHSPFLMGKVLLKQGRDADAVTYLQHAVELAPENPHALNFAGMVLASDADARVRNGQTALALATKANDLTAGIQPDVLDTLAMAYAETGQFAQAQQTAQDAIKLASALDLTNKVSDLNQRLRLYQNNEPFRQSFTNAQQADLQKN